MQARGSTQCGRTCLGKDFTEKGGGNSHPFNRPGPPGPFPIGGPTSTLEIHSTPPPPHSSMAAALPLRALRGRIVLTFAVATLLMSQGKASVRSRTDCRASDANLLKLRTVLCSAIVQTKTEFCGTSWKNVTAPHDWPGQVVCVTNLLNAMATPTTCLNTTYARDTVAWFNKDQANATLSGSIMNTWMVFQRQYFNMPRAPGQRIESADTLGRKCWAFTWLRDELKMASLERALAASRLDMNPFLSAYRNGTSYMMHRCEMVIANCFQNSSFTPSRNGTCPPQVGLFNLGFARENIKRLSPLHNPFP